MRIAIYSRVSTDRQDTQNQLVQLRAFVATQQDWQVVREYVDTASGKNGDRKEFKALFRAQGADSNHPWCGFSGEKSRPPRRGIDGRGGE